MQDMRSAAGIVKIFGVLEVSEVWAMRGQAHGIIDTPAGKKTKIRAVHFLDLTVINPNVLRGMSRDALHAKLEPLRNHYIKLSWRDNTAGSGTRHGFKMTTHVHAVTALACIMQVYQYDAQFARLVGAQPDLVCSDLQHLRSRRIFSPNIIRLILREAAAEIAATPQQTLRHDLVRDAVTTLINHFLENVHQTTARHHGGGLMRTCRRSGLRHT